ncbi:alpha/beta fold hydrolase [Streptomyces scopuliridis]|uniref:alpha/beta fold hydrolase n=1 Tax=Streptomyces scopuliridis TaxID=452529 RepID=UPI0036783B95
MDETAATGDRDETVLTDDGVRLWATRTGGGAGEPVILCHGGPGLWDTLEEPAALLPDTPASAGTSGAVAAPSGRDRTASSARWPISPDVTGTTLAGAGHMPWTEDPEGFRAAVGAFVRDVCRRRGSR